MNTNSQFWLSWDAAQEFAIWLSTISLEALKLGLQASDSRLLVVETSDSGTEIVATIGNHVWRLKVPPEGYLRELERDDHK